MRTAKNLVTKVLTRKVISSRNRGIDIWSINKRWLSEVWLDSTGQTVSINDGYLSDQPLALPWV